MAGMKKLGDKTEYGKVAGILWLGERYYMLLKDGVVSLMPASTIEAQPTVLAQQPAQQRKEICPHHRYECCDDGDWRHVCTVEGHQ
jgi:hypothetical protein